MNHIKLAAILTLISFFSLGVVSAYSNDSVLNYFWPIKIRNKVTYKAKGGISREVTIQDNKKKNNSLRIKTINIIQGFNTPVSFQEEYEIDLKKNVILRAIEQDGQSNKIYMTGPVEIGTKWSTQIIQIKGAIKNESVSNKKTEKSGECAIVSVKEMTVLSKKRKCIEINCYALETNQIINKAFYCKGIGYIGMKSVDSDDWIEKITAFKEGN